MKRKNGNAAALGRIGGKARAQKLDAKERQRIARLGGLAKAQQNGASRNPAGLADRTAAPATGSAPKRSSDGLFRDGADQRNHERNLKRQERRLKKAGRS